MSYDVVIVGGGTSGSVLAGRLSEDPGRSVLLLEAGPAPGRPADFPADSTDGTTLRAASVRSSLTWEYPVKLTDTHTQSVVRGKILGGSSSVNGGYFIRAQPADFNRWADRGGQQWAYDRVLPRLCRMENDLDFGHQDQHGGAGPMLVKRPWTQTPNRSVDAVFTAAALEAGYPSEPDKNSRSAPGIGSVPSTVVDGIRHNAAMQYILPAHARPNLSVRGRARVVKVRIHCGRAIGVEIMTGTHTRSELVEAGEVVLSAGALATPQLLLLSGIGDPDQLQQVGVKPTVSSPGVGRNLSDHPDISLNLRFNRDALDLHSSFNSEPLGSGFSTALHFSVSESAGIGDLELMLSSTPNSPLFNQRPPEEARADEHLLMLGLQRPASRGSLTLNSADPMHTGSISYGFLSSPGDRAGLRAGVRKTFQLLSASPFAETLDRHPQLDSQKSNEEILDSDDLLDLWIESSIGTKLHTCGGACMGPGSDPNAVVDQYGRVHGVHGLRVADLSILPTVPSRGPANTAVFIGEHAAEFME